ncbi:hypothetical protein MNBD_GAMMA08-2533 [hydrothermal vent metagenome]|uniref:Beta-ketoacyl synthase-like N-terminal domain-containing protein n=1 Tax=hydrothermal vent metagenome TaxID=652676 RepID=A0A3B0XAL0_9ZZZZ
MITIDATLESWDAWAPGHETQQQWQQWNGDISQINSQGTPEVKFLPAMFRRRLSRLSKLALSSAFNCIEQGESVSTVFASSHGELSTCVKLLENLASDSELSPTKFSTSVHNTASGMYSIANKDRSPSTSIAAGIDTLEMAFIEAASQLATHKQSKVMLVLAEEPVHEYYQQYAQLPEKPFALTLLLSNKNTGNKLTLSTNSSSAAAAQQQHGLSLIRLLSGAEKNINTEGGRLSWNWNYSLA